MGGRSSRIDIKANPSSAIPLAPPPSLIPSSIAEVLPYYDPAYAVRGGPGNKAVQGAVLYVKKKR